LQALTLTDPASDPETASRSRNSFPSVPHDELCSLASAAERGDRLAVRTLLTTIMPLLLRTVRRVLGPEHADIEDVAYEAAHAVLDGLSRFRGEATFRHYACRVAAFTALNVRRREAAEKRNHRREPIDLELCPGNSPGPEQQAAAASLAAIVRELVATLPRVIAEALLLHVILGYTVEEIAKGCGAPAETVRSRIRLGRQALRRRVLGSPALLEALEAQP